MLISQHNRAAFSARQTFSPVEERSARFMSLRGAELPRWKRGRNAIYTDDAVLHAGQCILARRKKLTSRRDNEIEEHWVVS